MDWLKEIEAALGHVRGKYMSEKRFKAFRETYNREPNFWTDPTSKVESDFAKACKLVDVKIHYKEFDVLVNQALSRLPT